MFKLLPLIYKELFVDILYIIRYSFLCNLILTGFFYIRKEKF